MPGTIPRFDRVLVVALEQDGEAMRINCKTLQKTLRPIGTSARRKVRAIFGTKPRLDHDDRQRLYDAIFEVENDLEHRSPGDPRVEALRAVRGLLADDLGLSDPQPGLRWPAQERARELIEEKRHKGRSREHMMSIRPSSRSSA